MVDFALNNAVHASTGFTPFCFGTPRCRSHWVVAPRLQAGGEARKELFSQVSGVEPAALWRKLSAFVGNKLNVISRERDAMALAQDKQKEYSDQHGRGNLNVFNVGDLVLLDTRNLPLNTVSSMVSNKLKYSFIGPFKVLGRHGAAYMIDLPKSITTHPTFYRYHDPQGHAPPQDVERGREEVIESPRRAVESQAQSAPGNRSPRGKPYPGGRYERGEYTEGPSE
ncbi:LOW QUALITY PROTEIN: Pol Polyprotein [Phytophthora megakarya]|uniref:Pol Polyprotein n=1 Tax=Phytophthora megakarya TaxID=4795 RepID=A0A225W5F5_9STRA|nr:LOW QUALITY PROTEIN: Pol Polyprotein [Phytophthora megakarya]